jgi:hypothetical protein
MHISQRYSDPKGKDHSDRERITMRGRRREGSEPVEITGGGGGV